MSAVVDTDAVAIIGMAGRFPGARDVREFWHNLVSGVDCITRDPVTDAHAESARTWIVNAGGMLDDVESFDAAFFAVPPAEAAWMDPQHRLFLECAWLALEDAGQRPSETTGPVSVYAGVNFNSYLPARLDQVMTKDMVEFLQIFMANEKDFLASRVSYKLNLRGESIVVQTSCSTSLVAVHLACQSLISGLSDMALAGGVSIRIPQQASYTYEAGMIASPDGHCRPFDARAAGTVPGNGVGVVVLKRLADAMADRDHCYAVIKGSWVNNDGRGKVGFTAPALDAQTAVIERSLAVAGVSADSISFVETHGTGTAIGDPIEIEALTRAFRRQTTRRGFCGLGAIKASIGHLDTAAGVAGMIKTALALSHRCLPPAAYFERPHPSIDLERSPFYISTTAKPWREGPTPRRAGVSGFGVGGTNAHIVLEEPPARAARGAPARPVQIVTLSAKSARARQAAVARLMTYLDAHPDVELRDVAYTQNVGRTQFPYRQCAVAETIGGLIETLRSSADLASHVQKAPSIVFMFAGQGTQSVGMARRLCETEPVFRDALEACLQHLEPSIGARLRDLMIGDADDEASAAALASPELTLPALLSVEYALVQVWRAWGVRPDAVIGHSYGELVAATVGGVFSLADAMTLAIERGRLMQRMPPGLMLAVSLSERDVQPFLSDAVALASVNGDARTVLSGSTIAMVHIEEELRTRGVACRRLNVPFAYHSALLDPLLHQYAALVRRMTRGSMQVRGVSSRTGDWLTEADVRDPEYWARQMREPVRFVDGLRRLRADGHTCFVEIGSMPTLAPLARLTLDDEVLVVSSLAGRGGVNVDWHALLTAAGRLWLRGAPIEWRAVERSQEGWTIPLPGYAFDRQRHWIEPTARRSASSVAVAAIVEQSVEASHRQPQPDVAPPPAATTTDIERTLITIWCEVLGRTSVGVHEDFLELGGDSLTAIRIQSRLQQITGIALPIEQFLTLSTISALAAAVTAREAGAAEVVVHAVPVPPADAQPLSFAQEWLWTLHQLTPHSSAYHLPIAVRLRGPFRPEAFAWAVQQVAQRHEVLRTTFPRLTEHPAAVVGPSTSIAPLLVDLSRRPAAVDTVVHALTIAAFDLATRPPWRSCVVKSAEDEHVAVFVLHHIISDAWSMRLLASEVAQCYSARCEGRRPVLRDVRMQYATFAQRQRASVDREGAGLVAYWKQQLAGVPPLVTLSRRARPGVRSDRGGRQAFTVDAGLTRRLGDLARRERMTLFMVLLAVWQVLLYRLSDQDDFCVGVPTAGRLDPDVEGVIGCFMNTLPIRASVAGDPTCLRLLRRVRQGVLDAFAHQAMPFERIVQELRPARTLSYTPLFQVVFDFNSVPRGSGRSEPGLQLEWVGTPMATAKTDLIVDLIPGRDGTLDGSVEFDRALFDDGEIAAMLRSFVVLLDAVATDPMQRIVALPLESTEARAARASGALARDDQSRERLLAVGANRRATRSPRSDA